MKHNYTVLPQVGVEVDFNNWNTAANKYGSREYIPKRQAPKKLIQAIIREFESICKTYHIDYTKYAYIEPAQIDGEWRQFDFLDALPENNPAKIVIHSIVASESGKVLQRLYEFQ